MGGKLKLLEIVTVTFVVFISLGIIKFIKFGHNYTINEIIKNINFVSQVNELSLNMFYQLIRDDFLKGFEDSQSSLAAASQTINKQGKQ